MTEPTVDRQRLPADCLPLIDEAAIDRLREFMAEAQIEALLTESLTEIDGRIRRLGVELEAGDTAGAAKEAHDLVSVAGNCGGRALSFLAREIEGACWRGVISVAFEAWVRLLAVAPESIDALSRLRDGLVKHKGF